MGHIFTLQNAYWCAVDWGDQGTTSVAVYVHGVFNRVDECPYVGIMGTRTCGSCSGRCHVGSFDSRKVDEQELKEVCSGTRRHSN